MVNLSAAMAPTFVQRVNEIVQAVTELGPNPLKEIRGQTPDFLGKNGPCAEPCAGNPVSVPEFPQQEQVSS